MCIRDRTTAGTGDPHGADRLAWRRSGCRYGGGPVTTGGMVRLARVSRPWRYRCERGATFTCCEPPGWSGPLGTPGDLLLVAVAAVRAAAADERTPAPTGSPTAQYLPADVTVRERGVGERAARLEALTRLLRTGLTTEAIAVRTGLSTRTLDRLRVAVDNPSP